MHVSKLLAVLVLSLTSHADILHRATCAGFLEPRPGKVLDSVHHFAGSSAHGDSVEASFVIGGRARRVSFVTAHRYGVDFESLPQDRLEVPMVNARLPLPSRRIMPFVRNVFDGDFFRGLAVLFRGGTPRITKSVRRGVTRYTYGVVAGSSVDRDGLRAVATHLYAQGLGRNRTLDPTTRGFEVAIGGRVFSGREFYAHLHEANVGNVPTPGRLRAFVDFMTGLSVRQLVRNAFVPAGEKPAYRPRFVYDGDAHGDLTQVRLSEIVADLEDRFVERTPRAYDVVVAGRTFTGDEFTELYRRMLTDGITSIHAERGFASNLAGRAAVAISQAYTWSIRAAGAALVLNVVPDSAQGAITTSLVSVLAASPHGSLLNGLLAEAGPGRVARVARGFAYLIPNYSALFDSSSFQAVEARRVTTLVDNVESALDRHDLNEITIITNGTRDIERLRREFDARFPENEVGPRNLPLRALSRREAEADPRRAHLADEATRAFAARSFATAEDFLAYYNPGRVIDVDAADARDVALVAFYFFRGLGANVPEFFRLNPDPGQRQRLLEIPRAFARYEFDTARSGLDVFGRYKAMRPAPAHH